MGKLKDKLKNYAIEGVFGIASVGMLGSGCADKGNSSSNKSQNSTQSREYQNEQGNERQKEIAIRELERTLNSTSELKEILGWDDSTINSVKIKYKVLNDSTYSMTYSDGKIEKKDMSISYLENNLYGFGLNKFPSHVLMFPSYIEIKVSGEDAKVVKRRP